MSTAYATGTRIAPPAPAPAAAETALFEAFQAHQAGQLEEAVAAYRRALAVHAAFPEALNNLGIALKALGRLEEAIAAYRDAIGMRPDIAEIWNNLGDALHLAGERDAAIAHYRRALGLRPEYGTAWRNLGDALSERGERAEAEECFRRAVVHAPQLDPTLSPAEIGVREMQQQFAQLVKEIEAASLRDRQFAIAYEDCAAGRGAPAIADEAMQTRYRLASQLRARYADQISTLLLGLHYDPATSAGFLRDAHAEAGRFFGSLPRFRSHAGARDPDRRLRIGYVSPDFRTHSVAYFLSAVFRCHDADRFELCAYAGDGVEDDFTAFFRSRSAIWRSTVGLDDAAAARMIHDDGVDILVDLAGHTKGNRLGVFARRPAPVQATWLGYPDATGLSAIDFRITDAIADPPGDAEAAGSERPVRLEEGFLCYTAPANAPDVAALPAATAGHITFGSFNHLLKVNAGVLDLWSAVLRRVPGSRLLLKGGWLDLPAMRRRLLEGLARRGIAAERLDLMGRIAGTGDHLAAYGGVDIALDTFPYNGVTTTCEALWMGVPVITLPGDRHSGRTGASLLIHAGFGEFVAADADDYVAKAEGLAADLARLSELRAGLRARFAASPVCDGPGFTRRLEAAYRAMWQAYCQGPAR